MNNTGSSNRALVYELQPTAGGVHGKQGMPIYLDEQPCLIVAAHGAREAHGHQTEMGSYTPLIFCSNESSTIDRQQLSIALGKVIRALPQ